MSFFQNEFQNEKNDFPSIDAQSYMLGVDAGIKLLRFLLEDNPVIGGLQEFGVSKAKSIRTIVMHELHLFHSNIQNDSPHKTKLKND